MHLSSSSVSQKKKRFLLFCIIGLSLNFLFVSCKNIGLTPFPQGVVSTLAGGGQIGSANGIGTTASFYGPAGVAVDISGNVYVTDQGNNLIRKITPDGGVSTFAGSGINGIVDGQGTNASFANPTGITIDKSGYIYVEDDEGGDVIRKISPDGMVSTLSNGPAGSANYGELYGLTIDKSGNIYESEISTNQIRKISPEGVVSIFAGSGSTGSTNGMCDSASFNLPYGLAIDAAGNIYVADSGNDLIRKITPAGLVSTFATLDDKPIGVVIDASGNLYVTSAGLYIYKISPGGLMAKITGTSMGGFVNGPLNIASFDSLVGITADASGNLYLADFLNNAIRKVIFNH